MYDYFCEIEVTCGEAILMLAGGLTLGAIGGYNLEINNFENLEERYDELLEQYPIILQEKMERIEI